ncbi:hypothetical protein [Hoeflea poritis]|uniref:DUF883 domain-containing protein n=1 Tax=Hoeflea poritis TaxID=2993659 RepID=A0ABT4VKF9_9HYPH|nr:hypothetical protein [Hoeflea poritis]MDA4845140.1 hypothetical protein [Hoeflea poritis]
MTTDLKSEIEAMRQEIAALKDARTADEIDRKKKPGRKVDKEKKLAGEETTLPADVEQALKDILAQGEKEVTERPLLAVGLAFALGVMLGRSAR